MNIEVDPARRRRLWTGLSDREGTVKSLVEEFEKDWRLQEVLSDEAQQAASQLGMSDLPGNSVNLDKSAEFQETTGRQKATATDISNQTKGAVQQIAQAAQDQTNQDSLKAGLAAVRQLCAIGLKDCASTIDNDRKAYKAVSLGLSRVVSRHEQYQELSNKYKDQLELLKEQKGQLPKLAEQVEAAREAASALGGSISAQIMAEQEKRIEHFKEVAQQTQRLDETANSRRLFGRVRYNKAAHAAKEALTIAASEESQESLQEATRLVEQAEFFTKPPMKRLRERFSRKKEAPSVQEQGSDQEHQFGMEILGRLADELKEKKEAQKQEALTLLESVSSQLVQEQERVNTSIQEIEAQQHKEATRAAQQSETTGMDASSKRTLKKRRADMDNRDRAQERFATEMTRKLVKHRRQAAQDMSESEVAQLAAGVVKDAVDLFAPGVVGSAVEKLGMAADKAMDYGKEQKKRKSENVRNLFEYYNIVNKDQITNLCEAMFKEAESKGLDFSKLSQEESYDVAKGFVGRAIATLQHDDIPIHKGNQDITVLAKAALGHQHTSWGMKTDIEKKTQAILKKHFPDIKFDKPELTDKEKGQEAFLRELVDKYHIPMHDLELPLTQVISNAQGASVDKEYKAFSALLEQNASRDPDAKLLDVINGASAEIWENNPQLHKGKSANKMKGLASGLANNHLDLDDKGLRKKFNERALSGAQSMGLASEESLSFGNFVRANASLEVNASEQIQVAQGVSISKQDIFKRAFEQEMTRKLEDSVQGTKAEYKQHKAIEIAQKGIEYSPMEVGAGTANAIIQVANWRLKKHHQQKQQAYGRAVDQAHMLGYLDEELGVKKESLHALTEEMLATLPDLDQLSEKDVKEIAEGLAGRSTHALGYNVVDRASEDGSSLAPSQALVNSAMNAEIHSLGDKGALEKNTKRLLQDAGYKQEKQLDEKGKFKQAFVAAMVQHYQLDFSQLDMNLQEFHRLEGVSDEKTTAYLQAMIEHDADLDLVSDKNRTVGQLLGEMADKMYEVAKEETFSKGDAGEHARKAVSKVAKLQKDSSSRFDDMTSRALDALSGLDPNASDLTAAEKMAIAYKCGDKKQKNALPMDQVLEAVHDTSPEAHKARQAVLEADHFGPEGGERRHTVTQYTEGFPPKAISGSNLATQQEVAGHEAHEEAQCSHIGERMSGQETLHKTEHHEDIVKDALQNKFGDVGDKVLSKAAKSITANYEGKLSSMSDEAVTKFAEVAASRAEKHMTKNRHDITPENIVAGVEQYQSKKTDKKQEKADGQALNNAFFEVKNGMDDKNKGMAR